MKTRGVSSWLSGCFMLMILLVTTTTLLSCSSSYDEQKQLTRQQRREMLRRDSMALKVAVMPTLDCLPIVVAKQRHFFDTLGVDVSLKLFTAQMDCDTALVRRRVEMAVSDLVRTERLINEGTKLKYLSATNAYWQLVANRNQRIRELRQLDDKMVAMARYSATDLLTDLVVDSARLKSERVFKIQVNDVFVRLGMLQNNMMDALWLTEPQATQARLGRNNVLFDTRKADLQLGVIAYREAAMTDKQRQQQLRAFTKAYNQACDSINHYGVGAYVSLLYKAYKVEPAHIDSLLSRLRFPHIAAPRQQDIERARKMGR
jgi:NitT/TauT family transport system substrate-binding protein